MHTSIVARNQLQRGGARGGDRLSPARVQGGATVLSLRTSTAAADQSARTALAEYLAQGDAAVVRRGAHSTSRG
jgi:hypothetical protein